MDNQKVIATLNDLLETTKDGERGFRACAEGVTSARLKTVFESAARRCDEGADELEAEIRRLGGEPAASGTVGGSLHRAWTNIKSSITGKDEHAVLAECKNDCAAPVPRGEGKSRSHPRSSKSGGPSDLVANT